MASVTTSQEMPQSVSKKLTRLRNRLALWIMVRGLGRWLMVVLAVLAADMLLDRVFKMDFAQRWVMLCVMAISMGIYFVWRVVKPVFLRANNDALIYEVEKKNPELKESLLSGVQLSREKNLAAMGVSPELVDVTIQTGLSRAEAIDFSKSLDLAQYYRNWLLLMAGLGLVGLLGVGILKTEFLQTWFNRNVLLMNDQWPQMTYLEIAGAKNGRLDPPLPRGADHHQRVTVTEASQITDVDVVLEVDSPGGRTLQPMKRTGKFGGREHVFVFHNVSSAFRFRAIGGDDVTEWVEVELVEPPNIIELKMQALMPAYTGIESLELVGNGPHALLIGSQLNVEITANKTLAEANLKSGDERFPLKAVGDDNRYAVTIPGASGKPIGGGDYEFELVDQDGVPSLRRSKFKITIKADRPPQVRANMLGISGLVVPRAMLPTSYQAADEYGLTQLAFECNWKSGIEEEEPIQRDIVFATLVPNEDGPIRRAQDVSVLDLVPLRLTPGTSFRFAVAATDNHPGEPGVGRSQEFLLRVVSDDELRADLLRREIEQRKAFDQAYQAQLELTTELQAITVRVKAPDDDQEKFDSRREAILISQVRSQKGIGTAIDRVAVRFEEFLVEVKNNRLDEAENEIAPAQRIETRFDEKIIQPIQWLDRELITLATRHMDNCRRAVRDPDELAAAVVPAVEIQQQILVEMKKILNAMNDSESFQEIINDILEVKQATRVIQADIKDRLKPKDIFDDDDDVFDK